MKRHRRNERGIVLVEFALIASFLTFLVLGVADLGYLWQTRMTVQNATRAGARVGSSMNTSLTSDYSLLAAVRAGLNDVGLSNVTAVIVYKSATSDGVVPSTCKTTLTSQSGSCNVYTGAQLTSLLAGSFQCGASALDRFWCPSSRQALLGSGPDYLGIWVKVTVPRLMKVFGATATITDSSVMRLEPLT
jgi:Flp pilus assembly protein TadG